MPSNNSFRHQVYADSPPTARYHQLRPSFAELERPVTGKDAKLRADWKSLSVDAVYVVHGTFTGHDALGMIRELGRIAPGLAGRLRSHQKALIDHWTRDVGNFTETFQHQLAERLTDLSGTAPVRLHGWSGENHHFGRAEAAVSLIDRLLTAADQQQEAGVLLWGHSHAGNVFALVTNLLASSRASARRFFAATRPATLARRGADSAQDGVWRRVFERLTDASTPRPRLPLRLQIVTFGTPIRYGWETLGYERLVHFVHHRPVGDLPAHRAPFPQSVDDLLNARAGDYVQQLAVAGTEFLPYLLSWSSWKTERRLRRLLQRGIALRETWARCQLGLRVPADGTTLLVDYPEELGSVRNLLFGHAVYTSTSLIDFHLREAIQYLARDVARS